MRYLGGNPSPSQRYNTLDFLRKSVCQGAAAPLETPCREVRLMKDGRELIILGRIASWNAQNQTDSPIGYIGWLCLSTC